MKEAESQICPLFAGLLHYFWVGCSSSQRGLILRAPCLCLVQLWFCIPTSSSLLLLVQQEGRWDAGSGPGMQ